MASSTKIDLSNGEQIQGVTPVLNGGTGATTLAGAGLELSINKNAANGYCGLNSSGYVSPTQLGSGSAASTSVLTGASTWEALDRAIVPEVLSVSAATSLTLSTTNSAWVFSGGTAATWTLPPVSGNTGLFMLIENRGTANLTIIPAGADHIWFLSSVTTITVVAGGSRLFLNDGTYWNTLSDDLTYNAVGVLPTANGGTGNTSGLAAGLSGVLGTSQGGTGQTSLTSLALTSPNLTSLQTTGTITEDYYSIGTVTTAYTINLANGTIQLCTLTTADTCVFTMPTPVAGQQFVLICKQPGTALVTFGSPAKWNIFGAPAMTQGAGKADIFTFFSDGTDWYGNYSQGYAY